MKIHVYTENMDKSISALQRKLIAELYNLDIVLDMNILIIFFKLVLT